MALPVATAGPSKPTEPPNPTVSVLVMMDENVLCTFMYALFFEMAYKTEGMPCPTFCLMTYFTNSTVSVMPMNGYRKNSPAERSSKLLLWMSDLMKWTAFFIIAAPVPDRKPTAMLRSTNSRSPFAMCALVQLFMLTNAGMVFFC